ncbi:MAG: iron-containing alcohol dehydrogenase [Candidatus Cloacimonadaceae bacterium]|nr:iron-containing alcohol dehydrogenase [Candidatus Cloacimonadaceae bacterium]MDP3114413.1 iron-containing alcohol dehydrogenase [Candidatus Cloacimonadaceae bacterium]
MENFSFCNPTKVHFGSGVISLLGKEMQQAGIKKCLLVAGGGSIRNNNVHNQVCDSLKRASIDWVEGWGVQANPTLKKARELIDQAKSESVDAILAVGGGSVIDTAKTVAAGFFLEDAWNAFTGKERVAQALPIFTVLTISATGSEMNGNAVITNMDELRKWAFSSTLVYPKVTIIDPAVQCSLPFNQTANGALDATAHILEYYFVDDKALSTLAINSALLKTIVEMTDRLKDNSCDLVARSNLAWSATLALNGISGIGLKGGDWACHQIEHAFSALNPSIAHGEGLGVIFPAWIEYMSERDPKRFQYWAKNVWGEDSVSHALRSLRDKIESWGSATNLRDLGIKINDLPKILEIIMSSKTIGAVSKFNSAEIEALLMLAY